MMTAKFCCGLFFFLLLGFQSLIVLAEDQDTSLTDLLEQESTVTLTMKEAVLKALQNNLDITVSRQSRDVRLTDILFQQAKFDPTVELTSRYDRRVNPLNRPILGFGQSGGVSVGGEPDNIDQNDTKLSLGFTQKLLTGGNYDLKFDSNRNSVAGQTSFLFNPSYTANFLFNLTQPLLRDFGPGVNATQIKIARNAAKVEQYAFVNQVLTVIATVEQTYWELVAARQNEKVAKSTLNAAQELLASNRAKVKAGVMAEVDVLQAQAGVASRVEQVLIAQKMIGDQEDQLRRLLSPSEKTLSEDLMIIPLDHPARSMDLPTRLKAIQVAMGKRPDVLQAEKNIENSQLNTRFAKNQLLPNLAFQGTVGLNGLGKKPGDTLDRTFSKDFYQLGGGLVLSYPIGNRSAESQYHRRLLETQQSKASLLRVRRQVIIDVKAALRGIQTDFKRIATTQFARRLAEKQLRAEQARLDLGLSTTRDVLKFQGDLAEARGKELRAVIDYNKSLSNLRRMTATAIDEYNLVLE